MLFSETLQEKENCCKLLATILALSFWGGKSKFLFLVGMAVEHEASMLENIGDVRKFVCLPYFSAFRNVI